MNTVVHKDRHKLNENTVNEVIIYARLKTSPGFVQFNLLNK